ncbi:Adenosylhomocysteinase 3 [Vulpes lagopus]
MSVQVVSAAAAAKVPEVELKDLSPSEAEPQLGLSTAAVSAMAPPAGGGDPEAPAPAAERPPAPGPGSGPAAALSPAAGKVPQASAMKRSDPHHQHQRHRDGGEALVSPDGTVTEAPRTVKKVLGPGCLWRREGWGGEPQILAAGQHQPPRPLSRSHSPGEPFPLQIHSLRDAPTCQPRRGAKTPGGTAALRYE